ncbi:MAG TPA: hypothetical protein VHX12_09270, partial [Acidisoma sp.]|nr:hypothetical protein [Acidisoma sp.]
MEIAAQDKGCLTGGHRHSDVKPRRSAQDRGTNPLRGRGLRGEVGGAASKIVTGLSVGGGGQSITAPSTEELDDD